MEPDNDITVFNRTCICAAFSINAVQTTVAALVPVMHLSLYLHLQKCLSFTQQFVVMGSAAEALR